MDWYSLLLQLIIFAVITLILICLLIIQKAELYPTITEYDAEKCYIDTSGEELEFTSIKESSTRYLSVIVPAYNEEERLPLMLDDCVEYLEKRSENSNFSYEILVVNDGSKDGTTDVVKKYSIKLGSDKIRCLNLVKNRGKGGAVRLGMFRARGELLLFADADGATTFADYKKVEEELLSTCPDKENLSESLSICCGSRAHLEEASVASRSYLRSILMFGFHFMVWLFTVRGVKDTQCGFKLMTRRTARILFNSIHIERWAFDVEMLFIAQKLHIPIQEVAVRWTEIDGSKVTPVLSWLEMGRDLVLIWLHYALGAWKIKGDITTQK